MKIVDEIREIEAAAIRDSRDLTAAELETIEFLWRRVDEIETRIQPAPLWKRDPQPAADDADWTAPPS